jgi:hypothetical protein
VTTYDDNAIFVLVDGVLATFAPIPYAWDEYLTDSASSLPETFLVASDVTDMAMEHANDQETLRFYRIQVSAYSKNGLGALPDVKPAMLAAGFMKGNRVRLPFNPDSGHFGLATDWTILIEQ